MMIADERLDEATLDSLAASDPTYVTRHGVYPALFACPNAVARDEARGVNAGGAFIMSPWAKASCENVSAAV
jgi:hypothetical protein